MFSSSSPHVRGFRPRNCAKPGLPGTLDGVPALAPLAAVLGPAPAPVPTPLPLVLGLGPAPALVPGGVDALAVGWGLPNGVSGSAPETCMPMSFCTMYGRCCCLRVRACAGAVGVLGTVLGSGGCGGGRCELLVRIADARRDWSPAAVPKEEVL